MFTGIVSDIGIVDNINSHGDIVIDVKTKLANLKTKVGDSISCSGICLSIIKKKKTTKKGSARKGQPAGARLAYDDTKDERKKSKKGKTPVID